MDYEKFAPLLGTWAESLKPFIESKEMDEIYAFLKQRSQEGRKICPDSSNTFRAFYETPKEYLNTIFLLQDPYPWIKNDVVVADGVAMSCRNTGALQPSLKLFYDGVVDCLPGYKQMLKEGTSQLSPDLGYLCNQGVMMLNTSLTTELNKPNSHSEAQVGGKKIKLWEPFVKFLFEEVISRYKSRKILIFCGAESQYYARYINPLQHKCINIEHPAAAAHKERAWNHEKIFLKINTLLAEDKMPTIDWLLTDPPF